MSESKAMESNSYFEVMQVENLRQGWPRFHTLQTRPFLIRNFDHNLLGCTFLYGSQTIQVEMVSAIR